MLSLVPGQVTYAAVDLLCPTFSFPGPWWFYTHARLPCPYPSYGLPLTPYPYPVNAHLHGGRLPSLATVPQHIVCNCGGCFDIRLATLMRGRTVRDGPRWTPTTPARTTTPYAFTRTRYHLPTYLPDGFSLRTTRQRTLYRVQL